MKVFLLSVVVLTACMVITESAPFASLLGELDEQRQKRSDFRLELGDSHLESLICAACTGVNETECTRSEIEEQCAPGEICTTLEAFSLTTLTTTVTRQCFNLTEPNCDFNPGCDALNSTGDIQSCAQFCCGISLCNAGIQTTDAPTTIGVTTAGPTTAGPTTAGPTTAGSTTAGPTTAAPTTAAPTTGQPTTVRTTEPQTTTAPATTVQTTMSPTTTPTVAPTTPLNCDQILVDRQGQFSSPNFPGNYPNGVTCTFVIFLPVNDVLNIQLLTLRLSNPGDSLTFSDGIVTVRVFRGPISIGRKKRAINDQRSHENVFGEDPDGYYDDDDYKDFYYYDGRRKREPYLHLRRKRQSTNGVSIQGANLNASITFRTDDMDSDSGFRAVFRRDTVEPETVTEVETGSGSSDSGNSSDDD
ncbi:threonine-rich protein-like [Montipora capricornis]|uniref:threonine-rich protein-like n=1 Tax=Montipora capricornis TaxID=246305 RepID=UPI0035F166E8